MIHILWIRFNSVALRADGEYLKSVLNIHDDHDDVYLSMQSQSPKNTPTLQWTRHAIEKMRFYRLSEARVKRIMENPKRREEGIADNTVACMQPAGSVKHPTEIWVMLTEKKGKRTIVSAWRYPGQTKPRSSVSIPDDALVELQVLS